MAKQDGYEPISLADHIEFASRTIMRIEIWKKQRPDLRESLDRLQERLVEFGCKCQETASRFGDT